MEFPLSPGLVQEMIGQNKNVISGMIYSNNGSTRIQTAPGHGELIVNSKGNFDNYYVTKEDIIYSEISSKNSRLEPDIDINKKKVKLKVKKIIKNKNMSCIKTMLEDVSYLYSKNII